MDPRANPYTPGAGTPPTELAGRDELIERCAIALDRIRNQRAARSLILHGLRGVGKTVLLNRLRIDAKAQGFSCVQIEVPEGRSLPAVLAPPLRTTLIKLDAGEAVRELGRRARGALAGFVSALKVRYSDIEFGMGFEPIPGIADSGDLESDLIDLFEAVGQAAMDHETAIVLFLDELQNFEEEELAVLITAFHRSSQAQLPITMVAAGLPQLVARTGKAKSYAERLFEFCPIGALDPTAAREALCVPAQLEGVEYEPAAVEEVLQRTQGYPYFLQEWGKICWDVADSSPITLADARRATRESTAELDAGFFRVRFERLTPAEKRYMRAMAELGPGPHRSGDIAEVLGKKVTSVAPTRSSLISKGMVYSPAHGDTAFTVPLFDGFMKRIMTLEM